MLRKLAVVALAGLVLAPAALAAQDSLRPRGRLLERRPFAFAFSGNRGRIGVIVNTREAESDRYGARVEGVTPGGPAAKAGLKAGDVITKFNGVSLAGVRADGADDSGPGLKLLDLARELDPGDTVRVEYRRGNDSKTATLVAEELGGGWVLSADSFRVFEGPRLRMDRLPEFERDFHLPDLRLELDSLEHGFPFNFGFGAPWHDLELVTLNPDLGEYFGTKEGILVVRAPADSGVALKAGDVILAIDGRKPTSVSHAMRILRSYDAGETVKVDILRKQKRQTITWTVPEPERRKFRRAPGPHEPM